MTTCAFVFAVYTSDTTKRSEESLPLPPVPSFLPRPCSVTRLLHPEWAPPAFSNAPASSLCTAHIATCGPITACAAATRRLTPPPPPPPRCRLPPHTPPPSRRAPAAVAAAAVAAAGAPACCRDGHDGADGGDGSGGSGSRLRDSVEGRGKGGHRAGGRGTGLKRPRCPCSIQVRCVWERL